MMWSKKDKKAVWLEGSEQEGVCTNKIRKMTGIDHRAPCRL